MRVTATAAAAERENPIHRRVSIYTWYIHVFISFIFCSCLFPPFSIFPIRVADTTGERALWSNVTGTLWRVIRAASAWYNARILLCYQRTENDFVVGRRRRRYETPQVGECSRRGRKICVCVCVEREIDRERGRAGVGKTRGIALSFSSRLNTQTLLALTVFGTPAVAATTPSCVYIKTNAPYVSLGLGARV